VESRRKILIVEDEWIIALDLKTSLERKGYDTLGPAPTVVEALALIRDGQVDAAILDVKLFDETSFAVADVLRQRCIPYVFSTGYNPGELPAKYSGVTVLSKPHDERELLAALRKMFGG
jgi:CheY-like chemotaxis protein